MHDFSDQCGGSDEYECTDQIADDEQSLRHYIFCDIYSECKDKRLYSTSEKVSHTSLSNMQRKEACVLRIQNLDSENTNVKLNDFHSGTLYGGIYLQHGSTGNNFTYVHDINYFTPLGSVNVETFEQDTIHLVVLPLNRINYLRFNYTSNAKEPIIDINPVGATLIATLVIGGFSVIAAVLGLIFVIYRNYVKSKNQRRANQYPVVQTSVAQRLIVDQEEGGPHNGVPVTNASPINNSAY